MVGEHSARKLYLPVKAGSRPAPVRTAGRSMGRADCSGGAHRPASPASPAHGRAGEPARGVVHAPPEATNAPEAKHAAGERRRSTVQATSPGRPIRPAGCVTASPHAADRSDPPVTTKRALAAPREEPSPRKAPLADRCDRERRTSATSTGKRPMGRSGRRVGRRTFPRPPHRRVTDQPIRSARRSTWPGSVP